MWVITDLLKIYEVVFKIYLTERKQVIKIVESISNSLTIKIVIPQGTILGPVLYMNSLAHL